MALHHFLIDWATADAGNWPPYALPLTERDSWRSTLDQAEQGIWTQAVSAYGAAVGRSLLFDDGLRAVRDWAAATRGEDTVPAPDRPLVEALVAAFPTFQRHWWPVHHERNRAWIASVVPRLTDVEDDMIARFEAAYGGEWPATLIPVDVMVYANPVGAYSTGGRLTIFSRHRGNQMPQAIEMIFHEASHVDEMEVPLRTAIDEAFRAEGDAAPDRYWHDVIFYTMGGSPGWSSPPTDNPATNTTDRSGCIGAEIAGERNCRRSKLTGDPSSSPRLPGPSPDDAPWRRWRVSCWTRADGTVASATGLIEVGAEVR